MPSLPRPEPIRLDPVEWVVVDAMICLKEPNQYKTMAGNMSEILRFIKMQNELIFQYETERNQSNQ